MLLLVLFLIGNAVAHNWLKSRSRSERASALRPALPRRNFKHPHVMVGPDASGKESQPFIVEWATGHNSAPAYFALLKSSDENFLRGLKRENLDEYLKNAPQEFQTPPPRKFRKYARKPVVSGDEAILDSVSVKNFFERHITEGMPNYIPRPETWDIGAHHDTPEQLDFKDTEVQDDRRAQYKNDKYPFIISVQRYTMPTKAAARGDFAQIVIPEGFPQGSYIVWYLWGGYSDMTDVDYVSQPITNKYGVYEEGTTVLERIDHCGFEQVRQTKACIELIDDLEYQRIWAFKSNRAAVNGYMIVPLIMPPQVSPHLRDIDIIPWDDNCKKEHFEYKTERTLALITVESRFPGETFDRYTTTNDPRDPFFYSTCLVPTRRIQFEMLPAPPVVDDVGWRHRDECLSCQLRAANSYLNVTPIWDLQDHCVNCDAEPFQGDVAPFWLNLKLPEIPQAVVDTSKNRIQCNGFANDFQVDTTVLKQLWPGGIRVTVNNGGVTAKMCYFLAARDPECADEFVSKGNVCFCFRRGNTCAPAVENVEFRNHNIYTFQDKQTAMAMFLDKY